MKKVVILGSAGFIGRNLKEYFERQGKYWVICPSHQELDLLNERMVDAYMREYKADVVFHCAIFSPKSEHEESEAIEKDLQMFLNLEKNKDKFQKMFYLGSGAEFDKTEHIRQAKEEDIGKRIPKSKYGLAKYVIGKLIEASPNIYNFRIWGLFGKYEDWRTTFISNCCCKAIKNYPLSIRQDTYFDYLWIDDFCRMADWAIEHDFRYHTYNAGSNRRVLLSEIAGIVRKISGRDLDIVVCNEGLGNEYTADSARLWREYGGEKITELEKSIRSLYAWYEQHQDSISMQELIYG